jgi:hypothetical protein
MKHAKNSELFVVLDDDEMQDVDGGINAPGGGIYAWLCKWGIIIF